MLRAATLVSYIVDRESKAEIWFTWDDEQHDHPEGWDWQFLLGGDPPTKGVVVNRVRITEDE